MMLIKTGVDVGARKPREVVTSPRQEFPDFGSMSALPVDTNHRPDQVGRARLVKEMNQLIACKIGLRVGAGLNFREIIWAIYQESSQLLDTTNFALAIYDDRTETLAFPLVVNQGQRLKSFSLKVSHHQRLIYDVLARQTPLLIEDLLETSYSIRTHLVHTVQPTRTWLGVPILHPWFSRGEAQGVIVIWSDQPNAFTKHQVRLLAALGQSAAIVLGNAQLSQAHRRQMKALRTISVISQMLASSFQLDDALNQIVAYIKETLRVEAGALLLTDPATGELVSRVVFRRQQTKTISPFRLSQRSGITGRITQTGKPLLVNKIDSDKQRFVELAIHLRVDPRNLLCVPLILYKQVIGVLAVINKIAGGFTRHDLALLNILATYTAIAIETARLHENVLAERDRAIEIEAQVRKKLARNLHDGPTQLVSSIVMRLDFCRKVLKEDSASLPSEIAAMTGMAQRAIHQMRTLLIELRPLELEKHGQGLMSALHLFLARRQEEIKDTELKLEVKSYRPDNQLSRQEAQVEAAIFTIVQETVNNALKHAQAHHISICLEETSNIICVSISDDGQGFDVSQIMHYYTQQGSLGLVTIQERAEAIGAELAVKSAPGQGTDILLKMYKAKEERMQKRDTTGRLTLPPDMLLKEGFK